MKISKYPLDALPIDSSCLNQCGKSRNENGTSGDVCFCDDSCLDNDDCCADYLDACVSKLFLLDGGKITHLKNSGIHKK